MPNPVTHFEIPADDTARAKKFYEKMFGWRIPYAKEFDYFMIKAKTDKWGIDGGMMKRNMPGQPFTVYVTVPSVDAWLKKAAELGGKVCLPKQAIGDMGAIGAFIDPESNLIGLHEMWKKPAAAPKREAKKKPKKR